MQDVISKAEEFFMCNMPKSRGKTAYIKHVELVRKYALLLGKTYSADLPVLEVAALLHDVGADTGNVHAAKSAEIAETFLAEKRIDANTKNRILSAIRNHSFQRKGEKFKENISIEDQILRDADGIAFLCDTFKSFFEDVSGRYPKEKAIEVSIEKIRGMRAKIKTKKGIEIANQFYPVAEKYISTQQP